MRSYISVSRVAAGRALVTLAVALAALASAGCTAEKAQSAPQRAATVTKLDDGTVQLTLTAQAAARLDIKTAKVSGATIAGKSHKVIPYSALFYDAKGGTWVYVSPEPLLFTRHRVVVENVVADLVIISDGPALETLVVTVGVSELYGLELGVGK